MPTHIEVILRSLLAFSLLLIGSRILGKQTISQMTIFDFITSISMGAIAANLAFNINVPVHHSLIAYAIFVLVSYLAALSSLKSKNARKFLAGDPTLLIQDGKILEKNMNKLRYTLDNLNQQLREHDIFEIDEVKFAIIETNGNLTALKKEQYQNLTKKDLSIPTSQSGHLPIELIMDSQFLDQNLQQNNISRDWVTKQLSQRKLKLKDVNYAVIGGNGALYIDNYNDNIKNPVDKE
ncbi:DUF421 domain-containing protein [Terribacillus saccharophilus]|uniref:DUF421 domain-containing protein n=1 Tax=Terribacillus saccharophilus TaxID=361277 RepID=UPI003D2C5C4B